MLSGLENVSDSPAADQASENTSEDEDAVSDDAEESIDIEEPGNTEVSTDTDPSSEETDAKYVTTEKSTEKLESMLVEQNNFDGSEVLDALLDSLIGDQP